MGYIRSDYHKYRLDYLKDYGFKKYNKNDTFWYQLTKIVNHITISVTISHDGKNVAITAISNIPEEYDGFNFEVDTYKVNINHEDDYIDYIDAIITEWLDTQAIKWR